MLEAILDRTTAADGVVWRASGQKGAKHGNITGHAAVFTHLSETLRDWEGPFRERISPGAFGDVLGRDPDVRLLIDHKSDTVLARTRAGNLTLDEDDVGLRFHAKVSTELRDAQELKIRMQAGLVTQCSFAFVIGDQYEDGEDENGLPIRTIRSISQLHDVSVVTYPAYPDTDSAFRMWIPDSARAADVHHASGDNTSEVEPQAGTETSDVEPEVGVARVSVELLKLRADARRIITRISA